MGLTHNFIGFPPIRINEKDNTINWCPHSCSLASIKGYLQEKANKTHITKTDIKSIMKEDSSIAFEICLTIHNRIMGTLDTIGIILIILICFIAESHPYIGFGLTLICLHITVLAIIIYYIIQKIYNNYDMNFKSKIYENVKQSKNKRR